MTLTDRIQAAIDACPHTRNRVLDLAGITYWSWQRRERNPELWRYREVAAIAAVLRCSYGELAGDEFEDGAA